MTEKTILQDFLEKRPDIKDPARIVDNFCPEQAGYDPVYNKDCHKRTCLECWNRPVISQKAFRDMQRISELTARAEAAEARADKLENEKDTAINDLRVCSIEGFMQCQYCLYKTAKSFCWNCTDGSNWKYRGEQEE